MAAQKRDSLDQLLARLNISGTSVRDTALYEVIKALIQRVKELSEDSGSSTTIENILQIHQSIDLSDGGGGGDDGIIVPGIRGEQGIAGITGAAGPPFPAFIFLEQEQAEDVLPIPGPTGNTGAAGNTGATGPQSIGFVLESDLPEDPQVIPGPAGANGASGSATWTLVEARVLTGVTTLEDFINLSGYSEILVICSLITKAVSGILTLVLSTDNGATFLTASGDYQSFNTAGSGALSNQTNINVHSSATTAARSGNVLIEAFNKASTYKTSKNTSALPEYLIPNTTAFNALRVTTSGGGNMTAGTIYVLGR